MNVMLFTDPPLLQSLLAIIKLFGGNYMSVKLRPVIATELEFKIIVYAEVLKVAVIGINDCEFTGIKIS